MEGHALASACLVGTRGQGSPHTCEKATGGRPDTITEVGPAVGEGGGTMHRGIEITWVGAYGTAGFSN